VARWSRGLLGEDAAQMRTTIVGRTAVMGCQEYGRAALFEAGGVEPTRLFFSILQTSRARAADSPPKFFKEVTGGLQDRNIA